MNSYTPAPATEQLLPAYIVGTGDFIDYACEECAVEFARQRGLTWHDSNDFTLEDPCGCHAYLLRSWDNHVTDSPASCTTISNGVYCGQYLDLDLSIEGGKYLLDPANNFPAWLIEAHGLELTDNN